MPYAFTCVGDFPFLAFRLFKVVNAQAFTCSKPCPKLLHALSFYMPYTFTCVGGFPFLALRLFKVGLALSFHMP